MKRNYNNSNGGCLATIIGLIGFYGIGFAIFIGFWAVVIYLLVWFLRYLQVIN